MTVEESIKKYAESQGLSLDDPRVKKYAARMQGRDLETTSELTNEMVHQVTQWLKVDEKFRLVVVKYAESQGIELTDPRVIKYALGLKGPTGDFGGREQESPFGRRA